jgi:hypothetical protein
MARLFVLNNYSLERVLAEVTRGDKPDHHLYGVNRFAVGGFEVRFAPFHRFKFLQKLQRLIQWTRFPIPLGDLDQQFSAWQMRRKIDLIYSPCQTQTQLLSYLRALGLFRVPIVTLAHHPLARGRWRGVRRFFLRWQLRGTDAFPSLSQKVADEINQLVKKSDWSIPVPWGPDLDYYPMAAGSGSGAVAAGRTGRDFLTFGQAATMAGVNASIICLKSDCVSEFRDFGSKVEIRVMSQENSITYSELCQIFSQARVLAIPLVAGSSLAGLTGLTDALGAGRPVIMTGHPLIDLDIEKEGIGLWVDCADVKGWESALRWFEAHPEEATKMGQKARALAVAEWNSDSFARRIMEIFHEALKQETRR